MSRTPTKVPNIVPLPPMRLAPPTTQAAMASSSMPVPRLGSTAMRREVRTMTARPQRKPQSTYGRALKRATLTPERRVASSLLPIE